MACPPTVLGAVFPGAGGNSEQTGTGLRSRSQVRTRPLEPESRQSTWLDVAVFALAFVLGVISYIGLRAWLGKSAQIPVTSTLVALMILYVAAVVWAPRLRVRMDQAGDNSYYLGLLFTLSSMAFA